MYVHSQAWRRAEYGEVVAASRPGLRPHSARPSLRSVGGARGVEREQEGETEVDVDILKLQTALQRSRAYMQQHQPGMSGAIETLVAEHEDRHAPLEASLPHTPTR
mgnify:CR=1 FL=1